MHFFDVKLEDHAVHTSSMIPTQFHNQKLSYVVGPDGSPLTINDLPPGNTQRWVARKKAQVVVAVRGVLLSLEQACQRYALTVEEFLSWQRAIDKFGLKGLRTSRSQEYRRIE